MITIALPKGRLGDKVYELLNRAGYGFEAMEDVGRKLVIEDEEKQIRYLLVKPVDVAVYVEKGAAAEGFIENPSRRLRVATKFENIARDYYSRRGRDAEFIHLNGSIELAPVLGLTDVIVDIVETGTTLKENHLTVLDRFMYISARLVANRSSYRFKEEKIREIVSQLKEIIAE